MREGVKMAVNLKVTMKRACLLPCRNAAMGTVLLIRLCLWPHPATGAETLVIDFDSLQVQTGHPIASGWLGGLRDLVPNDLVLPLTPSCIRGVPGPHPNDPGNPGGQVWDRLAPGSTIIIQPGARFNWSNGVEDYGWDGHWKDPSDCENGLENYPAKLKEWTDHVHLWVAWAESMRVANGRNILAQYDLFNEPDTWKDWPTPPYSQGWKPAPCWGDSVQLFLNVWKATSDSIRSWVPGAVITGPSFAYNVKGKDPAAPHASGVTMERFLAFCDSAHCLPTILGWHDIGNSEPGDPNLDDEQFETDPNWNLYAQVRYAESLVAGLGDSSAIAGFEINEMIDEPLHLMPGVMAREFALAERATHHRLLLACRTYWCDPCEDCSSTGPSSQEGRLAGLVQPRPDGSCGLGSIYLGKRYAWWTQKAYADLSGDFAKVTPSASLDGLAAITADEDTVRVLLGNFSASSPVDAQIPLRHLPPALVVNETVHILVKHMLGDETHRKVGGVTPLVLSEGRVLVSGDSIVVSVPGSAFGPGDALSIEVTRIVPRSTIARGE
jgi:hypothetical protein